MAATVLVVDDDIAACKQFTQLLAAHGYAPLAAFSHSEAWRMLENEQVDILVYELNLASSEGLNVLERIKKAWPNLPLIVTSALGETALLHAVQHAFDRSNAVESEASRQQLEQSNAELKERLLELRNDHMAGRELQMRMLPKPLQMNGVTCQHKILPALFLSGDFLDYFKISEHQIAFYLADVSGHGASSAFVTVILKKLIEQLKRNHQQGVSDEVLHPEQVLAFVSNDIQTSQLDKYLTMFYGVIDTQNMTLHYSVGGHLPMPVIYAQGASQYLEGRGMPVGLFAEASYNSYDCALPEDFHLLLFSDGVLELFKDLSMAEKEAHLLSLVTQCQGNLQALAEGLNINQQAAIVDDITMLSVVRSA